MKANLPRSAAAWQEPYDAIPRSVQARDDLTYGAKCLYGALQTVQRTKWQPTYAELAKHLAASTRSIIRWVAQLVGAGLIAVKRRGQGLSNLITVLGLVTSGGEKLPQPAVTDWQLPTRARHSDQKKKDDKKGYQPLSGGQCMGCRGDHATPACPRYGYVYRK